MKEKSRKLLYLYQRFFWYVGQAKNEALKPLGFWNETIQLLTWLAVAFNFRPNVPSVLGTYVFVLCIAGAIGKMITMIGIVRYNNKIGNQENTEIMDLHKKLDKIMATLEKNG